MRDHDDDLAETAVEFTATFLGGGPDTMEAEAAADMLTGTFGSIVGEDGLDVAVRGVIGLLQHLFEEHKVLIQADVTADDEGMEYAH